MKKLHLQRAIFVIILCCILVWVLEFNFSAVTRFTKINLNINMEIPRVEQEVTKYIQMETVKPTTEPPVKEKVKLKNDPLACLKYKSGEIATMQDMSAVNPRKGNSIFFHETSCRSRKAGKLVLKLRQACSVESAARANPALDVYLLVASPAIIKNEGDQSDKLIQALLRYRNIHIRHIHLEKYLDDTPIRDLYHSGKIETSEWSIIHVSDLLRYVSLWKYGGIYLDLDVIVIKTLENLVPNFSGLELPSIAAAGIMGFDYQGKGHQWVEDCLNELNRDYRPDLWSHNAIGILNKYLKKNICKVDKVENMKPEICEGFKLYTQSEFYPITYGELEKFFEPKLLEAAIKKLDKAWTVHLWNKLTENRLVKLSPNNSLIEYLAKEYCPYVYQESNGTL